jgi:hypothetical protein
MPDLISAQLIQLGAAAAVITGSSIKCALQCRLAYMRATAIADVLTDNALGETVGSEKREKAGFHSQPLFRIRPAKKKREPS